MDPEQWRVKMGQGLGPWVAGPGMSHQVTDTSWSMISGAPSADVNMRLVWGAGAEGVAQAMTDFDDRGLPALVMLAGPAKSSGDLVPEGWQNVGDMPIMQIGLAAADRATDPRVRHAGAGDVEAVTGLLSAAFGMSVDVAGICCAPLLQPAPEMQLWLLEDEGVPVSTVTGTFVDETFSVWSMATPDQFARRGYGRALLASVLEEAYRRGATIGLLGATPAGLPLYEATGWSTFETWDILTNAVSAQFH